MTYVITFFLWYIQKALYIKFLVKEKHSPEKLNKSYFFCDEKSLKGKNGEKKANSSFLCKKNGTNYITFFFFWPRNGFSMVSTISSLFGRESNCSQF